MKLKIIHIMDYLPAYEEYSNQDRPAVSYDIKKGNWVGIWGDEWADRIGEEVLKVDQDIEYEVWQPDLRADKIYSHRFKTGLVHKNFPSKIKKYSLGLKREIYYSSSMMLSELKKLAATGCRLLIVSPTEPNAQNKKLSRLGIPLLNITLGLPEMMVGGNWLPTRNPIKLIHRNLVRLKWYRYLRTLKHFSITEYLPRSEKFLKRRSTANIYTTLMGFDLDLYQPMKKSHARKLIGAFHEKYVLFASSRLVSLKQVDKLIIALARLKDLDFILYISGHGTRKYEEYLQRLIDEAGLGKKVMLVGYISERKLVEYYCAADVFVNTSMMDAGPTSSWKAMALGIPVVNTNVGNVYHFLEQEQAGLIIDKDDCEGWSEVFRGLISGNTSIRPAGVDRVRSMLEWKVWAQKYARIFREVESLKTINP